MVFQGFVCDTRMFNEGRFDSWNTARDEGMGMSYWKREDLPYYFTLYDNFLVGDQYFQSTFTETDPNRLHLFSGSNGNSMGYVPALDNTEPTPGWKWETMGETLEKAGISWKVYQQVCASQLSSSGDIDTLAFPYFFPLRFPVCRKITSTTMGLLGSLASKTRVRATLSSTKGSLTPST